MVKLSNKQFEKQQDSRIAKLEKRAKAGDRINANYKKRILALEKQVKTKTANIKMTKVQGAECTRYEISETFVTETYVDKKLNSIIIGVDPYNEGTLVIEPSQQTISGIFMILIGGQEWRDSYIEENKVTVNFPWATEKIEIIGESVGS